jgi:hypothetical protein
MFTSAATFAHKVHGNFILSFICLYAINEWLSSESDLPITNRIPVLIFQLTVDFNSQLK